MVTQEQIDSFHRFASEQLHNGASELSLHELVDLWRMANPTPEEYAANVAAIRQALDDMEAGDTGEPVEEVLRELREELGLTGTA